jgi:hypothetical protein
MRGVVFSWVFVFYSGHPALDPSGQLRCAYALLRLCGQVKEKYLGRRKHMKALAPMGLQTERSAISMTSSFNIHMASPIRSVLIQSLPRMRADKPHHIINHRRLPPKRSRHSQQNCGMPNIRIHLHLG